MDDATLASTEDLADELAANDRPFVDPRTIPTRFSLLKQMAECPAKYLDACQRDQDDTLASRLGSASTDKKQALRFGNACHAMLFGTGEVARFTEGRRAGKRWEAFQRDAAERGCVEILNEREHATASAMVDALRRNRTAVRMLLEDATEIERRVDWQWMGKACRSTPDARGKGYIVDLKTARSANPIAFVRQGAALFYHCQAAFYQRALDAEAGVSTARDCYVIAIEKVRPFPVTVLRFTDDALDVGARTIRLWFEMLLACEAASNWPEYVPAPAIADFAIEAQREPMRIEIDGELMEVG
jgi:hypothetical protein